MVVGATMQGAAGASRAPVRRGPGASRAAVCRRGPGASRAPVCRRGPGASRGGRQVHGGHGGGATGGARETTPACIDPGGCRCRPCGPRTYPSHASKSRPRSRTKVRPTRIDPTHPPPRIVREGGERGRVGGWGGAEVLLALGRVRPRRELVGEVHEEVLREHHEAHLPRPAHTRTHAPPQV